MPRGSEAPSGPNARSDADPITFVNVFEIEPQQLDSFLVGWRERAEFMSHQPGFRSFRLHRALSPESRFQLINVAEWGKRRGAARRDVPRRLPRKRARRRHPIRRYRLPRRVSQSPSKSRRANATSLPESPPRFAGPRTDQERGLPRHAQRGRRHREALPGRSVGAGGRPEGSFAGAPSSRIRGVRRCRAPVPTVRPRPTRRAWSRPRRCRSAGNGKPAAVGITGSLAIWRATIRIKS